MVGSGFGVRCKLFSRLLEMIGIEMRVAKRVDEFARL